MTGLNFSLKSRHYGSGRATASQIASRVMAHLSTAVCETADCSPCRYRKLQLSRCYSASNTGIWFLVVSWRLQQHPDGRLRSESQGSLSLLRLKDSFASSAAKLDLATSAAVLHRQHLVSVFLCTMASSGVSGLKGHIEPVVLRLSTRHRIVH